MPHGIISVEIFVVFFLVRGSYAPLYAFARSFAVVDLIYGLFIGCAEIQSDCIVSNIDLPLHYTNISQNNERKTSKSHVSLFFSSEQILR